MRVFYFVDERYQMSVIQKRGFQSVDENTDLLTAYLIKPVIFNGVDLMNIHADAHPSLLGRSLRKEIFGGDGLTDQMIDSANSPKGAEAPKEKTAKFKGLKNSVTAL